MAIHKAVIPAAGLGTRFLPATKTTPKEMLPVVDKPAVQYVVEEAAAAGLDDVLVITGRGKSSIEDHFDCVPEVERALERSKDDTRLAAVRHSTDLAHMHFVRQGVPLGLGHAVLQASDHVGNEPFVVMLGDDLIDARDPLLPTMIEVQQRTGGSVIALLEVPPDQASLYGVAEVAPDDEGGPDQVRVTALVEKPAAGEAPSNLAVIGRYVLNPAVFDVLRHTEPGRGGEIQLTDALAELATLPADQGGGVFGVIFRGRRYDTGDRLNYLKATVRLAVDRDDLGADFRAWLAEFVDGLRG